MEALIWEVFDLVTVSLEEGSQAILAACAGGMRCRRQAHVDFSYSYFSWAFMTTWSADYDNLLQSLLEERKTKS